MSILKGKPQPVPEPPATSSMERRMTDLESQIRYREYTPEARAIVEANDKRDAEQAARRIENNNRARENGVKRCQLIKDTLTDLIKRGNLKISVDGERVYDLNDQSTIPCSICKTPLSETGIILQTLSERWIAASGDVDQLVIRDARGPLSVYVGMPFVTMGESCRACGTCHRIMMQLSVLV